MQLFKRPRVAKRPRASDKSAVGASAAADASARKAAFKRARANASQQPSAVSSLKTHARGAKAAGTAAAAPQDSGAGASAESGGAAVAAAAPAVFNLSSDAFEKGQAKRKARAAEREAAIARKAAAVAAIIAETDEKLRIGREMRLAAEAAAAAAPPPPPPVKRPKMRTTTDSTGLTLRAPSRKFREFNPRTGRGRIDGPWKVSAGTPGVMAAAQYAKLGVEYADKKRAARRVWPWLKTTEQTGLVDRRRPRPKPTACGPQVWFKL